MVLDPYTADRHYFECIDCLHRFTALDHRGTCPQCGSPVQNLAVRRE